MLGAFVTDRDTTTRLDSANGDGTDLDLEDDLGLESSMSVVRVAGYYWVTPRYRLDVGYFDLSRRATKAIQETIDFGDRPFVIDTAIETENEGFTAPLPVVGLRGDYVITDRFTLRGAAQWFALETVDVAGTLRDSYVGADYGFGKRMAVGLAYNQVAMGITADEAYGFQGSIDWGYDGLLLKNG